MGMISIQKEELDWLRERLSKYAETIGRIKATLEYSDKPSSDRLARIKTIIEVAEL